MKSTSITNFRSSELRRFAALGVLLALSSCTFEQPQDPVDPGQKTTGLVLKQNEGQFIDSPVKGLQFRSGQKSGNTNASGVFTFESGQPVEFYVGDIVLGSADPAKKLSPLILAGGSDVIDPTTTNIARFLQTIDNDANPANGINVTGAVRNAASGKSINFVQSIVDFENDPGVQAVVSALTTVTDAGTRPLIDVVSAQANLYNGIRAGFIGQYHGSFCVADNQGVMHPGGEWAMTINANGKAKFEFVGTDNFKVTCAMALTGNVNANAPELKIQVCGSFAPGFLGRWSHGNKFGTFSEGSSCVALVDTECEN
jgi:hypothetical protein